jgi:nucleoside-diphosphate-sugar epimerase
MGKTIGVTGHEPAVSLEDGVTRTFEWYRAGVFEGGGVSAK